MNSMMMATRVFFLFFLVGAGLSCAQKEHENGANNLINESSPYLLQHAYNPVDWNPWKEKVLEKAIKEDKLLIISIGYAACHWCHVMEHESFEDSTVAKLMNDNFISIKVDREERPDIDQVYMEAAYLTNQRGGWPLNVIALPDGKPVYAGTYFPKNQWIELLTFFSKTYVESKDKLIYQGAAYEKGINRTDAPALTNLDSLKFQASFYEQGGTALKANMDAKYGGRIGAPKFPMPAVLEYMLQNYYFTGDEEMKNLLTISLKEMARGGIYDQIGGGFARYSTDERWTVPHFEKMLYDNAQLMSVYSKAFKMLQDEEYRMVVDQTFDFLEREMSDPNGGFYSSLDADSEGEEGKFYVWTVESIDELLGDQAEIIKDYYGVTRTGNFEHKNILTRRVSLSVIANKYKVPVNQFKQTIRKANGILLEERNKRIRPGLDDKVLTSWNALMVTGLLNAYQAFGEDKFLERARRCLNFILKEKSSADGGLLRNYKDGKASINGFHDDYALTIEALIKMYESTFEERWLLEANRLKGYTLKNFLSEDKTFFYYTSGLDKKLIARKMELTDNVIPGSNSIMAHNLYLLGHYFYDQDDIRTAKRMLKALEEKISQSPNFYSNWLKLYGLTSHTFYEVAIVGENAQNLKVDMNREFLPNIISLGGVQEGSLVLLKNKLVNKKTYIYVCEDKLCKLPVNNVEQALTFIEKSSLIH